MQSKNYGNHFARSKMPDQKISTKAEIFHNCSPRAVHWHCSTWNNFTPQYFVFLFLFATPSCVFAKKRKNN